MLFTLPENERKPSSYRITSTKTHNPLKTDDVKGAQPRALVAIKSREKLDPVEGSCPKQQHPIIVRNKTQFSLQTNDVEGAQPHVKGFRTKRVVNPLQPTYHLPNASAQELDIKTVLWDKVQTEDRSDFHSKFATRDTKLNVSDITIPKKKLVRSQAKNPLDVSDIHGTKPTFRYKNLDAKNEDPTRDSLYVNDINKPISFKSTRTTNPNEPDYDIYHREEEFEHRRPWSSKDRGLPSSLVTQDVPGATSVLALQRVRPWTAQPWYQRQEAEKDKNNSRGRRRERRRSSSRPVTASAILETSSIGSRLSNGSQMSLRSIHSRQSSLSNISSRAGRLSRSSINLSTSSSTSISTSTSTSSNSKNDETISSFTRGSIMRSNNSRKSNNNNKKKVSNISKELASDIASVRSLPL